MQDASALRAEVESGTKKLATSAPFLGKVGARSLQERLRPLFCAEEVTFASDTAPFLSPKVTIEAPLGAFVDPMLLAADAGAGDRMGASTSLVLRKSDYAKALAARGVRFPESGGPDADHAFLAPVKAPSDAIATAEALREGVVDAEFVADVLSIDFTEPVFSPPRCALLRAIPDVRGDTPLALWNAAFLANLESLEGNASSETARAATELKEARVDASKDAQAHAQRAEAHVAACRAHFASAQGFGDADLGVLLARRAAIAASEVSSNPRGRILEPGFRVIFPEPARPVVQGAFRYEEGCVTVEGR